MAGVGDSLKKYKQPYGSPSGMTTSPALSTPTFNPMSGGGGGMKATGMAQGPTPWWQTTQGAGDRVGNLQRSAPPGYTYDPVQMAYVPTTSTPAYQQKQQEEEQRKRDLSFQQQQASYQQRQSATDAALRGLSSGFGGGGGGGTPGYMAFSGATPTVQYPQVSMSPAPDASAAQSAAFSQAKSRAGAMGRSALESLRGELADRGILGGGTEARGIASQLAATVSPLSDLNVAQLHEQLGIAERGQQLGAQQAGQQYQGGIAQRGQDIQNQQFQAQLAQQMELARMQQLQQALSGLMRSY